MAGGEKKAHWEPPVRGWRQVNAWRDHSPFYGLPPSLRADAEQLIAYGGAVSVGGRVLPKVPRTAEILLEQVRHTPPLQRCSQQM